MVLGVTTEGYMEILCITVGANESSKFWMGMLNALKNRGVQDVLFVYCVYPIIFFRFPSSQKLPIPVGRLSSSLPATASSAIVPHPAAALPFSASYRHILVMPLSCSFTQYSCLSSRYPRKLSQKAR